jgi:N-acetylglucosaminyldiphosphoundecaprenol N-acetyl-beta-D-mannosaminyltransferase
MPIDAKAVNFLNIAFAPLSYAETAEEVARLASQDTFSFIVTPNVDHVLSLFPEPPTATSMAFEAAYKAASLRLCDSKILKLLARMKGLSLSVVTGSDLTAYLFQHHFGHGHKIAIIGGEETDIAELAQRYPDPHYVQHQPPMGVLQKQEAIEDIISFIQEEQADYVLFAIGAPQSEIIAHRAMQHGGCKGVALCIGASIEFILGHKSRAPLWMQKSGLEWAFRLLSEPKRLWRRYLLKGPRIFIMAAKWRRA